MDWSHFESFLVTRFLSITVHLLEHYIYEFIYAVWNLDNFGPNVPFDPFWLKQSIWTIVYPEWFPRGGQKGSKRDPGRSHKRVPKVIPKDVQKGIRNGSQKGPISGPKMVPESIPNPKKTVLQRRPCSSFVFSRCWAGILLTSRMSGRQKPLFL